MSRISEHRIGTNALGQARFVGGEWGREGVAYSLRA